MTLYEFLIILITLLIHYPAVQKNATQLYKRIRKRLMKYWTRVRNDW
ncbi:hypothetical protein LOK74_14460 [Brevibacillus humidisoli]|nr:hypothetical protein [Brevibacillus humidisoli]UFJ39273.1 hypothetical protein LOK74_14460 [Brevibacillus humidisoli]